MCRNGLLARSATALVLAAFCACGQAGGHMNELGASGAAGSAGAGTAPSVATQAGMAAEPARGDVSPAVTGIAGSGAAGSAGAVAGAGGRVADGVGGVSPDPGPPMSGAGGSVSGAVQPIEREGKYVLEFDDVSFEVDPERGARVTRYAVAGQNLLTGPEVDATNWGSTFWPSPQARWNWPPVPELDSEAYEGGIRGDAIELTSRPAERVKLQVTKRFRASAAERAIVLEYRLTNQDSVEVSWAGWEISRVAPNGLTFFPTGDATVNNQLSLTNMGDISWYRHDPSAVPMGGVKFSGDGRGGWLAHAAQGVLWVKTFEDVPNGRQAPAPEGEIEIYAAPGYVEIEPQGPYTALMPGESLTWSVRWRAQKLADAALAELGNAALVQLAESLASD